MATESHFEAIQKFDVEYADIAVSHYVSTKTGMRVVVAFQPGPMIYSYLTFATEIHNDSGAPHTLEHLCFMGSKSHTNPNFLEKLVTRAYGYDNAWTETDNTTYELNSAGWQSFAQVLPVYLDHVLYPILSESTYVTEVHHIDGEGKDGGVVYCEMQASEKDEDRFLYREAIKHMYPPGHGYRSETGGELEQLRQLSIEQIRDYHCQMYRPDNLCIAVSGEVNIDELLAILTRFELERMDRIAPIESPAPDRPWVKSGKAPSLTETIQQTVEFPEKDESTGSVVFSWLGPHYSNRLEGLAINLCMTYLTGSTASVLNNILVEREQLCANVDSSINVRWQYYLELSMIAVPSSKLQSAADRFLEVLKDATCGPLDMTYMSNVIARARRQFLYSTETNSSGFLGVILSDHLFGDREGVDLATCAKLPYYEQLANWTEERWRDFMSKWLIQSHHVKVLGKPSSALSKKLDATEKQRVEEQQRSLGKEGLKKAADRLAESRKINAEEPEDSDFEGYPQADVSSIHLLESSTARAGLARSEAISTNDIQKLIDHDDQSSLPLFLHYEHIPSNFVTISIYMSVANVSKHLRPLTAVYYENLFATPIMRDGRKYTYEQVVKGLEADTNGFGCDMNGANSELLTITLTAEVEKYEQVIEWLRDIMYNHVLDEERLLAAVKKIIKCIPLAKREGGQMAEAVCAMTELSEESTVRSINPLVAGLTFKRIRAHLKNKPDAFIADLRQYIETIHQPSNYRIAIVGDVTKLKRPVSSWTCMVPAGYTPQKLNPMPSQLDLLSQAGKAPARICKIMPMSTIESSYTRSVAKGPASWTHEDLPALYVAEAYMNSMSGPFMATLRGAGLVYGIYMASSQSVGQVYCDIYRSSNPVKAFQVAHGQVKGLANGTIPFNQLVLEGAIAGAVKGLVEGSQKYIYAAFASVGDQVLLERGKNYGRRIVAEMQKVTAPDVRRIVETYYVNLFEPSKMNGYFTCAETMKEELVHGFTEAGFAPQVHNLSDFEEDYGWTAVGGVEDDEEDDDDDDGDDSGEESEA